MQLIAPASHPPRRRPPALGLLAGLAGLALTACATPEAAPEPTSPARPAALIGATPGRMPLEEPELPSLREMQELDRPSGRPTGGDGDRLREAALSYGARGGLAWGCREINRRLMARASELSRNFDFHALLIRDGRGATLLPPVVSEARRTLEEAEDGRVLRAAEATYEIVAPARFSPTAPLWHAYLLRECHAPEPPPPELLPRDEAERRAWRDAVAEGWAAGERQAEDILRDDLRRLERDFQGMLRYAALVRSRHMAPPQVAVASHGVTGSASAIRVGDRTFRITGDAALRREPALWRRLPSTMPEDRPTSP